MKQLIEPKILKGTRDFLPQDMAKRNLVMDKIKSVFKKFGYDQIETPIICPAETILGKYGDEGEKLTYNFEMRGGTRIALPYDLTVPFARFFAVNFKNLPIPFKRYQIQRVWRAEKPQKGRLREFYQCDIDIIGSKSLICEAEVAKVIVEVFKALGFKDFKIKINSRRLINNVLKSFSVIEENFMDCIRIIDKLEKIGKENVVAELESLGIQKAEKIIDFLTPEKTNEDTSKKLANFDLKEISEFMGYCKSLNIPEKYIEFDPSLARGLDYYTGITYEVVSKDTDFGTLCAGGRYDNLCSLFCEEDFSGVGVAFGFERIMLALEEMDKFGDVKSNSKALVTIFNEETKKDALKIYSDLIKADIGAEIYFQPDKLKKQFKFADKKGIQFVITRGPEEIKKNTVTIKSLQSGKQKEIPYQQLTSYFKGYYEGQ
ncbi:histidine--tRNA ligase [Patescibacteria group bacterium]|nr:histidine--tRNA ligase [Patescibacteria group bacterium]